MGVMRKKKAQVLFQFCVTINVFDSVIMLFHSNFLDFYYITSSVMKDVTLTQEDLISVK